MSEHYLRLIREEMKSPVLTQIPQQRLELIMQTIRKLYCNAHELDNLGKRLLVTLIGKITNDVKLLIKIRFLKFILQEKIESNSADQDIAKLLLLALKSGEALYSPITLRYGDKILYKFNSTCRIGEKTYRRGEIALLSILEVASAEINGCGQVMIDPFFNILAPRYRA